MNTTVRVWSRLRAAILWVVLIALVVLVVYPLVWMVLNGFKTNEQVFGSPFALPTQWGWSAYVDAWQQGVKNYLTVSVLLTILATAATELLSAWAAFGLTKTRLPRSGAFTGLMIAGLMLAPSVAIIPLVTMFQRMGLYNTFLGLLILYTAFRIPFTVFLIRGYMLDLPHEVDEAAAIDGTSRWGTFWRITLPMCTPIMITTTVLNILLNWNEYLFATVFTSGSGIETLPVGLADLMSRIGTHYPTVFAGMVIGAVPMVVLFFACQRYFVRGIGDGVGK
ncbi:carbohydrate ABC transporter permease [Curtobacterium sp. MCPF17_002]|uniref:carbohydrate ABC transporter permease n=1 Tax=Curtobacterium sp. MCPF17_002 TaxID=2175645 RepID=UPI0021ABA4F6|nr:carbohydrate ABC transporter permease [Curtobacterium sp. MCPF17_002]WIB77944.1 carbohydrate ABC transporter permease [Curtobacterium sp. MCPF17_002]